MRSRAPIGSTGGRAGARVGRDGPSHGVRRRWLVLRKSGVGLRAAVAAAVAGLLVVPGPGFRSGPAGLRWCWSAVVRWSVGRARVGRSGCVTSGSRAARRRVAPGSAGQTAACPPWTRMRAARSGPSGSATVPLSSSRPCASRTARGGNGGCRSATAASAANTSSGRTAGVSCRTTMCSMAQPASSAADALATDSARVDVPEAVLRALGDGHDVAGEERLDGRLQLGQRHAGQLDPPDGGVDPVGQGAGPLPRLHALQDRRPRRAARRPAPSGRPRGRSRTERPISRYSASLAAPVGAAPR